MEIEIRAKLTKGEELINSFKEREDIKFTEAHKEDDLYFKHATDINRRLILRIRRRGETSILTFKGKSKGQDTAWPDIDLSFSDPKSLENLLLSNNYIEVTRITKERVTFTKDLFEINIDNVDNLGWFIEIEGQGTENERKEIEAKILNTLIDLGIKKEQIIKKGYVPLMLEKNNHS